MAKGPVASGFCCVPPVAYHSAMPCTSTLNPTLPSAGIRKVAVLDWDVHHGNGIQVGQLGRAGWDGTRYQAGGASRERREGRDDARRLECIADAVRDAPHPKRFSV